MASPTASPDGPSKPIGRNVCLSRLGCVGPADVVLPERKGKASPPGLRPKDAFPFRYRSAPEKGRKGSRTVSPPGVHPKQRRESRQRTRARATGAAGPPSAGRPRIGGGRCRGLWGSRPAASRPPATGDLPFRCGPALGPAGGRWGVKASEEPPEMQRPGVPPHVWRGAAAAQPLAIFGPKYKMIQCKLIQPQHRRPPAQPQTQKD